jgi:hypothetical protein
MPTLSPRIRWLLGLTGGLVLIALVLIQTVPFIGMAWGSLTGGPGLGLVRDLRGELLQQEAFRQTLRQHEQEAVRRYQASGRTAYQRRHLVRINLTPLGLPGFHDIFAVRVRTDLVDGAPKTGFLARPGVAFSEDDGAEPDGAGPLDPVSPEHHRIRRYLYGHARPGSDRYKRMGRADPAAAPSRAGAERRRPTAVIDHVHLSR